MTAADQLAAIEARVEAATEGPWDFDGANQARRTLFGAGGQPVLQCAALMYPDSPNAEFIAHARTDIPALLATIREQAAKLEAVRVLHKDAHRDVATWARGHRWTGHHCTFDGEHWPCETIAALGAGDE